MRRRPMVGEEQRNEEAMVPPDHGERTRKVAAERKEMSAKADVREKEAVARVFYRGGLPFISDGENECRTQIRRSSTSNG